MIIEIIIIEIDKSLEFFEMLLSVSQSNRALPIWGCCLIHLCNLGELLKKHHDANKINGVVGNNGKNIPIIPSNREIEPKKI